MRFHSVLTLLLACLIFGAGTQAAVCELECGLGGGVPCHSVTPQAPKSTDAGIHGMGHMHCSGMRQGGSKAAFLLEPGDGGGCRHSVPVAVVGPGSSSDAFAQVQWIRIERVSPVTPAWVQRCSGSAKSPPLPSMVDPVLISLRV